MKYSIIHPYFNHTVALPLHLPFWERISKYLGDRRKELEIVLIDDHSPENGKIDISLIKTVSLPITVAHIDDNIIWNVTGARNLGAALAVGQHLIMPDFDYVVTPELIQTLDNTDMSDSSIMRFPLTQYNRNLRYGPYGKVTNSHCNSFVIHKVLFDKVGGYDEDFAGSWGSEDSYFIKHLCKVNGAKKIIMEIPGFFFVLGFQNQGEYTHGRFQQQVNYDLLARKLEEAPARNTTPILRFRHHIVYRNGY